MSGISLPARPKINLFLHVTGRRADGYHLLESLVCFAEMGDRIAVASANDFSLEIDGPFSAGLEIGEGNLVMRAASTLQVWAQGSGYDVRGAAITLQKNLPVASGIGGGSADAAAALNALARLWDLQVPEAELEELALKLGADVPVCLQSRTQMMRGIGEELENSPALPPAWILLTNPMVEVSTAKVFSALDLIELPQAPIAPPKFETAQELGTWLNSETRNDLEIPALSHAPEIATVLDKLVDSEGAHIARMSGSGATCFALFDQFETANAAAESLAATHPNWWVQVAKVLSPRC